MAATTGSLVGAIVGYGVGCVKGESIALARAESGDYVPFSIPERIARANVGWHVGGAVGMLSGTAIGYGVGVAVEKMGSDNSEQDL